MSRRRPEHRVLALLFAFVITLGGVFGSAMAAQPATPIATPVASPGATPVAELGSGEVDLDVLFIGAHPDDEAFGLGTYGQWNEFNGAEVGVITITRGEGGGNAVGTEEGPALGLLREAEERNAVGKANVEHIYNLDKVDFYYTVSAQLTEETWGYEDTLEQVVRVVRETKPEIIITMNPSPTPGQHGHHQIAGRLAIDAFYSAADESVFPEQIDSEGLDVWRASRILRSGASGEGTPGPDCATTYRPMEATDYVFGVWGGTPSDANGGDTWATIERRAQQSYASQGWAVFPDAPTDPAEIDCDYFTFIDSRAPFDPTSTETRRIAVGLRVLPDDRCL
jgi:LmbE family N-acetylglucosaminyl deacetylase